MDVFPAIGHAICNLESGISAPGFAGTGSHYNQRLPTDPLFYANITMQNIVIGSRYWVANANDLTTVLATGIAASSEVVLKNMPAYTNPMLIEIRVRNASNETAYYPFSTFGYLIRDGATVYIAQIVDTINE